MSARKELPIPGKRGSGPARVTLWVVLWFLLVGPGLAWGHPAPAGTFDVRGIPVPLPSAATDLSSSPPPAPGPSSPSPLPVATFLLAALALGAVLWRRKKAAAVCLVLTLGFFAFETALHSVHHLADPQKGAQCQIFSTSQHVSGATTEAWDLCAPAPLVDGLPFPYGDTTPPASFLRPDQGRAPPSLPA